MRQTYAILGAGRSSAAVISYLQTHGSGEIVLYVPQEEVDTVCRRYAGCRVLPDTHAITQDVIVRSPGIRPDLPRIREAESCGAHITAEIEMFCSLCPAPIYAVTGSDGKTTTATLAAEMLKEMGYAVRLGGNIGVSLLEEVDTIDATERVVLELSSFQLMTFSSKLAAAAVTNLTENHLNWHTDYEEYRRAKRRIFYNTARRIQNACFPIGVELPSLTFSAHSTNANYYVHDGQLLHGPQTLCSIEDIRLRGVHNQENILCAAALTDATPAAVRAVVKRFDGVRHRMEYLGICCGVHCYNSSIDTTPSRTAATLASVGMPCTVICGGSEKHLSYQPLIQALLLHATRVVFTGACGEQMQQALCADPAYRGEPTTNYCKDFYDALNIALEGTSSGQALLLSPAAASFDAFSSYEERGDAFRNWVLCRNKSEL